MQRIILPFSFLFPFLHYTCDIVTPYTHLVLMRDEKEKKKGFVSIWSCTHVLFHFSFFLLHTVHRVHPVLIGYREIPRWEKGEYRSEQWAANWCRRRWGSLYRPDYRSLPFLFFFFFLLDPLRLNDVSLYHATRKTFLCFAFSCPLLNRASGNIFPRNMERKGFSSATDIFAI